MPWNLSLSNLPTEIATEVVVESQGNGVTLPSEPSEHPHLVEQHPSVANDISHDMGSDDQEERSDTREDQDEDQDEDEDTDMSEEGAALTMTLSHAEQLNAELDMLDAEVMGSDNLAGLLMDNQYYYQDAYDEDIMENEEDIMENEEDIMENEMGPDLSPVPNIPVAMSAVSQQLQHIQDGQGHADLTIAQETQHAPAHDNSTSPPLLFHGYGEDFIISLADISSVQQPVVTLGSSNAPHLWGTGGWTPSPATDVILPSSQDQSFTSHVLSSDVIEVDGDQVTEADLDPVDDQFNLSLSEFLSNWAYSSLREDSKKRPRGPDLHAVGRQREVKHTGPMTRNDLHGDRCDIQRINWAELGVSRLEARQMRRQTYKNYTNLRFQLQWHPRLNGARLPDDEDYFRFRKMDLKHVVHLSHFQLRNLLSCASRDHIFYAGRSVVHHYNPTTSPEGGAPPSVIMDLTNPTAQPAHAFSTGGVQISTLTVGHDILVAGGFSGEYGMINLKAPKKTQHTEGIITHNINGITNHVQVHLSRTSSSPLAVFASNDMSVRVLDISTNKFIAEHKYEHAINCTAPSPDKRLRVLVGDRRNVMICNAETGEVLQDLEGHRDYGFACDWADDGWTVATGNQDMQIKIWDARKWKARDGRALPVATIAAEMAGVRKLKFSPLGSGKRVLIAAEPADFVNVIDADTFTSKQTLSFFGEIGGVDFTNDGQDLIVANCDSMRGGIMEYERCNLGSEATHSLDDSNDYAVGRHGTRREQDYYNYKSEDAENIQLYRLREPGMRHSRRAAMLGTEMGIF